MSDEEDKTVSSVPKLSSKATAPEYLIWARKTRAHCQEKGCAAALKGEGKLPKESAVTTDKEELAARTRNEKCVAILTKGALNTETLSVFTDAETTDHPGGNAKLIWDGLAKKFTPKDDLSDVEMKQDLKKVKMSANEHPNTLFEQIAVIRARYAGIVTLSDSEAIATVVAAAPRKYQTGIVNEKRAKGTSITLDDIKSAMDMLYRALEVSGTVNDDEDDDDAKTKARELSLAAYSGKRCHKCHKIGHIKWNCPLNDSKGGGSNEGGGGGGYSSRGKNPHRNKKCHYCNKSGHIEKQCWKKHPHLKPGGSGPAAAAIDGDEGELLVVSMSDAPFEPATNNGDYTWYDKETEDEEFPAEEQELNWLEHLNKRNIEVRMDTDDCIETDIGVFDVEQKEQMLKELLRMDVDDSDSESDEDEDVDELLLGKIEEKGFPSTQAILYDRNVWIADTAATMDSTAHEEGMQDAQSTDISTTGVFGPAQTTKKVGTITGPMCNKYGQELQRIKMKKVGYNKRNNFNLFSITKRMKQGWALGGDEKSLWIEKGDVKIVFDICIETKEGRIYAMYLKRDIPEIAAAAPTGNGQKFSITKAHGLLCHKGEEDARKTAKALGWTLTTGGLGTCEGCSQGKAKQKNVPKKSDAKPDKNRVYLDISTLKKPKDKDGKIDKSVLSCTKPNWRIVVTERENLKSSEFYKKKSDMPEDTCVQFKRMQQEGRGVKYLRMDNAGENNTLADRMNSADWQLGIQVEYTARDTPQQNHMAELGFASIAPMGRACLAAANVPRKYRWRLFPRVMSLCSKVDGLVVIEIDDVKKTRYEQRLGHNPKWAAYLRTFGEAATVKTRSLATSKVEDRGTIMMFVDYADSHSADTYIFWHEKTGKEVTSRDAIWLRRMYFEPTTTAGEIAICDDLEITVLTNDDAVLSDTDLARYEAREGVAYDVDDADETSNEPIEPEQEAEQQEPAQEQEQQEQEQVQEQVQEERQEGSSRPSRVIRAPERLIETIEAVSMSEVEQKMYQDMLSAASVAQFESVSEIACVGAGIIGGDVQSTEELRTMKYDEAMANMDPIKVRAAIKEEHNKMKSKKVFMRVKKKDLPDGAIIISTTWAIKKKPSGTIRARMVARGFEQIEGVHYKGDDISAPVTSWFTIRIVMILTLMQRGILKMQDTVGAFLLGKFEDGIEIYIEIPQGFEEYYGNDEVLFLCSTLYGTKQAAMAYYKKMKATNSEIGLKKSIVEPCLFYKWSNNRLVLNTSWVDDNLYGGSEKEVNETMKLFRERMECDDVSEVEEYIGCKVDHNRRDGIIKITQPVLIKKLRDEFNIEESARTVTTPAKAGSVLERPKEGDPVLSRKKQSTYRSIQGILQYMTGCSRLELGNTVRETARQNSGATEEASEQLQRTAQYVLATENRGLMLKPTRRWNGMKGFKFRIRGKSDSTYAVCPDDRKSGLGWCVYLEDAVISAKSATGKIVMLSVTETEIAAAVFCVQDMMFAYRIILSIELEVELPMVLEVDNKGAVDWFNNWSVGGRTRHMDTKAMWIRELKEKGILKIIWTPGDENESDILTKNVDGPLFERHGSNWVTDEEIVNDKG